MVAIAAESLITATKSELNKTVSIRSSFTKHRRSDGFMNKFRDTHPSTVRRLLRHGSSALMGAPLDCQIVQNRVGALQLLWSPPRPFPSVVGLINGPSRCQFPSPWGLRWSAGRTWLASRVGGGYWRRLGGTCPACAPIAIPVLRLRPASSSQVFWGSMRCRGCGDCEVSLGSFSGLGMVWTRESIKRLNMSRRCCDLTGSHIN